MLNAAEMIAACMYMYGSNSLRGQETLIHAGMILFLLSYAE